MKGIPIYLCLISVLLLLGAGEAPGQEKTTGGVSDPFVGTWVLNLDKSSKNLPIKSDIVTREVQDNSLKIVQDRLRTDGRKLHWENSPKYDGKDYPQIGPYADRTVSCRRINTNSFECVGKLFGGVEIWRSVSVYSEDGMTNTVTVNGRNLEGGGGFYSWVLVYDKQED